MYNALDTIEAPELNCGSMFGIYKRITTKFRPLSEKDDIL